VRQDLRRSSHDQASRDTFFFHELAEVLRALAVAGVKAILLKGAALAKTVYLQAMVRPMRDMDLLVSRQDVEAALQSLAPLGYVPLGAEIWPGADLVYRHSVALCKPDGATLTLELHWTLFAAQYYQHRLSMEWFWEGTLPVQVDSVPAWTLGPEAQLLHLCGHLVLHHGSVELLWLRDIAEVISLYRTRIRWEQLLKRAQMHDLLLPLQRVLPRLAEQWRVPIPESVLQQLSALRPSRQEQEVFTWLTDPDQSVARRFWADLMGVPGWPQRLRFLSMTLFPSPKHMQQRYGLRHRLIVPLYYPYHWILSLRGIQG
jgi:hypothetical protein